MAENTTPTVYVICDQNCKFESMTKEQILTAIAQAIETGEIGDVDTGFVTTIKTISGTPLRFFVGEQSEYDALTEEDKKNLFAIISNDTTKEGLLNALATLQTGFADLQNNFQSLENGLANGTVVAAKATNADNATHAATADNATHAATADNATHAATADNATGLSIGAPTLRSKLKEHGYYYLCYSLSDPDLDFVHEIGVAHWCGNNVTLFRENLRIEIDIDGTISIKYADSGNDMRIGYVFAAKLGV